MKDILKFMFHAEGWPTILIVTLIGVYFGVFKAVQEDRKIKRKDELHKYSNMIRALLNEASGNLNEIRIFQDQLGATEMPITVLSTNVAQVYLFQSESYTYSEETMIYVVNGYIDIINIFVETYKILGDEFKNSFVFTDDSLRMLRERAISVDAFSEELQNMIEEHARLYKINKMANSENKLRDRISVIDKRFGELQRKYGIQDKIERK